MFPHILSFRVSLRVSSWILLFPPFNERGYNSRYISSDIDTEISIFRVSPLSLALSRFFLNGEGLKRMTR